MRTASRRAPTRRRARIRPPILGFETREHDRVRIELEVSVRDVEPDRTFVGVDDAHAGAHARTVVIHEHERSRGTHDDLRDTETQLTIAGLFETRPRAHPAVGYLAVGAPGPTVRRVAALVVLAESVAASRPVVAWTTIGARRSARPDCP